VVWDAQGRVYPHDIGGNDVFVVDFCISISLIPTNIERMF